MTEVNSSQKTKRMVLTAVMTALVFIATYAIRMPVPFTQGYIHIGDSMIFIAVVVLGWRYGAFAAGVGSALADLLAGYPHWILPTLIIKTIMAILMGLAIDNTKKSKGAVVAFVGIVAVAWALFSYYMKKIILTTSIANPNSLIGEVDGAVDLPSLVAIVDKAQTQLQYVIIIIPVALVAIGYYTSKRAKVSIQAPQIIGMTVAGFFMVLGYYTAAGVMYGSFVIAAFSVPWNIIQFIMGFLVAELILIALRKAKLEI